MKFGFTILVALVVCLFASVHGGETDVIRVFRDKPAALTDKEMDDYLEQADLESHGFKKTVEISTETDKYGKTTTKKTVYYKATDDCSKVGRWENVLNKRLPKQMKVSKLSPAILKEVQNRIFGRNTKSCTVILEIHYKCSKKSHDVLSKRTVRRCGFCLLFCFAAAITYE